MSADHSRALLAVVYFVLGAAAGALAMYYANPPEPIRIVSRVCSCSIIGSLHCRDR